MMQLVVTCGVTAFAAILLSTVGCRHPDFARERLKMRDTHIAEVADVIGRSETRRPSMFGWTANRIRKSVAIDVTRMSRNQRALDDYVCGDFERFGSRLPEYRRHTERILWGRPDTIERNAISLFY